MSHFNDHFGVALQASAVRERGLRAEAERRVIAEMDSYRRQMER